MPHQVTHVLGVGRAFAQLRNAPAQPFGLRSSRVKKHMHDAGNHPAASVQHRPAPDVLDDPSTPLTLVLLWSCGAGASDTATATATSPAKPKVATPRFNSAAGASATSKAGPSSAQQGKPHPAAKAKATSPPRNYGKGMAATSGMAASCAKGKAGSSATTDGSKAGSSTKAAGKEVVWKMGRILADVLVGRAQAAEIMVRRAS